MKICGLASWPRAITEFPQPPQKFTMETESENVIYFLDVLVNGKERTTANKVYRKSIYIGRYFKFNSKHLLHVKGGLILSPHKRVYSMCLKQQDLFNESSRLLSDLQLNGYPRGFTDSVIISKGSSRPSKGEKSLGPVYIPCMNYVSERFKGIRNQYNIRMIFKTKHIKSSLMNTRPERSTTESTVHL
jgi:hypothetical protein